MPNMPATISPSQVWQEHFLYLRKSPSATVVLHLGGPYESWRSDMVPGSPRLAYPYPYPYRYPYP